MKKYECPLLNVYYFMNNIAMTGNVPKQQILSGVVGTAAQTIVDQRRNSGVAQNMIFEF